MEKRTILTLIFVLFSHVLLAQVKTDTIAPFKGMFFTQRTYKGKKIGTTRRLSNILRQDPEAFKINRKAMRAGNWGLAMDGAALAAFIYTSQINSHSIADRRISLITGYGFLVGTFVFILSEKHYQQKAVNKFNSDARKTSYNETKPQLYLSY